MDDFAIASEMKRSRLAKSIQADVEAMASLFESRRFAGWDIPKDFERPKSSHGLPIDEITDPALHRNDLFGGIFGSVFDGLKYDSPATVGVNNQPANH